MGKFKAMDIEQKEIDDMMSFMGAFQEEMWIHNVIHAAVELCKREDYGYSKFLDELHKALNEARGKEA